MVEKDCKIENNITSITSKLKETKLETGNYLEVTTLETSSRTSRKLASIQIISEILEHTNADKLVIAKVLGWNVVCSKGDNLKANDKVIYFEIDSLLPESKEWCQFLKDKKFKLKTAKIRGELSQGLIMPLKILAEYSLSIDPINYTEGQDLTNALQVTKYETDADEDLPCKANKGKKSKESEFPSQFGFVKTEEPRIQSSPKLIELFSGKSYYVTLKYDGTSSTYFLDVDNNEFYICSRNMRRSYDKTDVYSVIADKYKIKEILEINKGRYAIQGETYGPKIQNNPFKITEIRFAVFSIYDYTEKRYIDYEELVKFCADNKLTMVDVILEGDSFGFDINKLKEFSKGMYPGTTNPREGLVFRLKKDWSKLNGSFKIINDDFLLVKK